MYDASFVSVEHGTLISDSLTPNNGYISSLAMQRGAKSSWP